MSQTIKGLVLCADGAATSTIALVALREAFEEMGVPVDLSQGRVADAAMTVESGNYDFIVSTAGVDLDIREDVPIFSGVPFLTGVGKDQFLDQLRDIATNKQ